jgi:pantoate--beta-alanine ligase
VVTAVTVAELRAALAPRSDTRTGLVPTMGAFHDGHLALMRRARAECETVVVSLFVNPAQFGEPDDLARYPRNPYRDAALAVEEGVDVLFAPSAEEMYPPGFQTWVEVEDVSRGMEGEARPGHFRAVATVCLKLFNLVRPAIAYFGQKDAQQVAVVERMTRDLDVGLEIRVVPTVRDADGLALSSRNALLSPEEREAALALPRALDAGLGAHRSGGHAAAVARTVLIGAARQGVKLDYVEEARLDGRVVLAAAVRVGDTRLIDNVLLEGALS